MQRVLSKTSSNKLGNYSAPKKKPGLLFRDCAMKISLTLFATNKALTIVWTISGAKNSRNRNYMFY